MTAPYVIVAVSYDRNRVIGPFETAAQASGQALELFGPLTFGCSTKWTVQQIEAPKEIR